MKNFYNIALGILFGLVLILFFLQLKSTKNTTNNIATLNNSAKNNGPALPMAFFDIDSINERYTYCKEVKTKLEKIKDEMDAELSKLQQSLENTQQALQKKNAEAPLSQQEQENAMATLQKMQQNISVKREEYITEFENTRKQNELDLKKDIQNFIKKYNTPQRFSYIVADEPGVFYYKDSVFNITTEVLNGLNSQYKSKN
jgi:outer membrane protein